MGPIAERKKCSFSEKLLSLQPYLGRSTFFNSGSPTSSSMPHHLPHQCPNFVLKLLNFTSTTNCPNLCFTFDTQTLCSSFILTNPLTTTPFFLYSDKPFPVIFLAVREYQT
ncbi:hypothetical protein ACB092_11G052000 [Castanea dentata]